MGRSGKWRSCYRYGRPAKNNNDLGPVRDHHQATEDSSPPKLSVISELPEPERTCNSGGVNLSAVLSGASPKFSQSKYSEVLKQGLKLFDYRKSKLETEHETSPAAPVSKITYATIVKGRGLAI